METNTKMTRFKRELYFFREDFVEFKKGLDKAILSSEFEDIYFSVSCLLNDDLIMTMKSNFTLNERNDIVKKSLFDSIFAFAFSDKDEEVELAKIFYKTVRSES